MINESQSENSLISYYECSIALSTFFGSAFHYARVLCRYREKVWVFWMNHSTIYQPEEHLDIRYLLCGG